MAKPFQGRLMPDSVLGMVGTAEEICRMALALSEPWEQTLHVTELRSALIQLLKVLEVYATSVPRSVPLVQQRGLPVGDSLDRPGEPGPGGADDR